MSTVRLTAVDGIGRGWQPDIDSRLAVLESAIDTILQRHRESITAADQVTLVPDAHYPFHPSTGTVTDPAVIGALAAWINRETDADLAVVGRSDERITFDRTASYLGYKRLLARFDAELIDVADDDRPRSNEYRTVDGQSVALTVPDRLLESAVIVVPTVRPTADSFIAGGMRTLSNLVNCAADPALAAVAATRTVDPELTLLDGTIAYGSEPVAANALFAGPTPAVDAVGSSLLGRSVDEDDAVSLALPTHERPVTIENPDGADVSSLQNRLSDGQLPPSDDTHPAISTAYQLYATVSGDAVPPQLEGR